MPKYVISSTLENPEWNNTQVLRGDVAEEARKLTQKYERDIVVHGSPQLAQTLIEHDLVGELRLMVYPVIVGAANAFSPRQPRRRTCASPKRRPSTTAYTCSSTGPPERARRPPCRGARPS